MAKNKSFIRFTGKVGDLIGYRRGGKYFLRSRPETVRQTQATKHAAQWFGAASRKGALIRSALAPDIDYHCDPGHVNQLNKIIVKAGRNNHAGITGFRFNRYAGVERFLRDRPTFTKDGVLHIPAQEIWVNPDAVKMEVKVIATRIDFTTHKVTGTDAAVTFINLEKSHTHISGIDIPMDIPGKGT